MPKAIHFDVFLNGQQLMPLDPIGLRVRWMAAFIARAEGVEDMRNVDKSLIDSVLTKVNCGSKYAVRLSK